jgi:hypothetical protein
MSIALPVRRRRPAPKSGWVCRPKERPMSTLPSITGCVTDLVAILLGTSFFTRKAHTFGGRLGLQQRAVGSRLAGEDKEDGVGDKPRSDPSVISHRAAREVIPDPGVYQRFGRARHCLRASSYWNSAVAGMTYKRTPMCTLSARMRSRSNGLGSNLVHSDYGHEYPYFRERDREHDLPEHHIRDVPGERGFSSRPRGEAERRQG